MNRNVKKEVVIAKRASIIMMLITLLFTLISMVLFIKKDVLKVFPRMDIAWIGFAIVSFMLFLLGLLLFHISRNENNWISETDERKIYIESISSMIGYLLQTILLGISFFLLTFMGYLNKTSGFTIVAIILISGLVTWGYGLYLRKHK